MAFVAHGRRVISTCRLRESLITSSFTRLMAGLELNSLSQSTCCEGRTHLRSGFGTSEVTRWKPLVRSRVRPGRPPSSLCLQSKSLSSLKGYEDLEETVHQRIKDAASLEDLFDIMHAMRSKGLTLSLSDGVNALQRLMRLRVSNILSEKERSMSMALVKGISQRMLKGGETLELESIPVLAHALAKLRLQDNEVQGLVRHLRDHLISIGFMYFRHVSIGSLAWSFACFNIQNKKLFARLEKDLLKMNLQLFTTQSISNILWAFATVGFPSDTLLLKFQEHLLASCIQLKATRRKKSISGAAQSSLSPRISIFSEQGIGNILWAVATIGTSIEKFKRLFEVCEEEIIRRGWAPFNEQGLSVILWSYTSTGFARDQFVSSVEQEIISRGLKSFNNHTLCILTRSFTLFASFQKSSKASKTDDLDLRDSDEIRKISEQELEEIEEVEVEVQVIGKKFFQQLVEILRSCDSDSNKRVWDLETCSRLLINIVKLPAHSVKREVVMLISKCILASKSMVKVSNKSLCAITWTLVYLRSPSSQEILERLIDEFKRRDFKSFSPSELTKAIWAFTVSGCYDGARVIQNKCIRLFLEEEWLRRAGWDLSSVSSLSWSCMKAENTGCDHMQLLEDFVASLPLSKGDMDDLSNLLWIHVVLERGRLDYINLLLEPIFARLDQCRAANLTQIAQALVAISPLRKNENHDGQLKRVLKKLEATWRERKLPHSSGMHRGVSTCLQEMRFVHWMEYRFLSGIFLIDIVLFKNRKAVVAVEVDGPMHFNRVVEEDSVRYVRCIESRWKDKILRQEGLTVISIPFYEWDSLLAEGKKDQQQAYLLAKLEAAGVKLEELDRLPQPSDTAATSS